MISRISSSPSPLSYILSVSNEKYSSGRKKSPPSRCGGGVISKVQKKTTHSLQVKGLYHRAGTDHLKRLKIKNQVRNWLKRTILLPLPEGGSPFRGGGGEGGGTSFPGEIFKFYAPNEAIWGYSTSFHIFFSPLKIQKNFETMIRQRY